MAWEHLDINKPHLAYIILGGFTSLFMLCSLFVKEKLYIGEATVATLVGVIFGPHAANLFNPLEWGNTDQITLECSRIVLVVQCFAVGVELPKSYMERHWRSVIFLLLPVMTYGWLVTSLFIWWMVEPLTWLESLVCAACVTATDPVLASSVVGKGKFAKRVPKHLRDLLSAESGCNDGMAFPFIYLSVYLIAYRPDANQVALHWFCYTILYECIFGAIYGFLVGYGARHSIKYAEKKGLIDRESFLVFYFVLALFCAGSGSMLGMDDLLIGFSAGVGFSNDGWFTEKTEESHVSNVIDLLLNLAYFVYLGSIIPWEQYNAPDLGLIPWKLVVISLFVIFFRRIPIMMALKPIIPDVKTWREALFAGHFGPIGVGAIFAAILARAELEHGDTEPLAELPGVGSKNYMVIKLIWPITTFMVISSILVHGSSIAVFTLGKRINTLTLTMSYTQGNDEGPSWMNRLPRIASTSRASMSFRKEELESSSSENVLEVPPGLLPPVGVPGNFLRRQKEEEANGSRPSSVRSRRRRKQKGMGGPISQSAIAPVRKTETEQKEDVSDEKVTEEESGGVPMSEIPTKDQEEVRQEEPQVEAYQEGHELIVEDEEGNVLKMEDTSHDSPEEVAQYIRDARTDLGNETSGEHAKNKHHPHEKTEGDEYEKAIARTIEEHTGHQFRHLKKYTGWKGFGKGKGEKLEGGDGLEEKPRTKKRGPAHAYQFGNTIIVEDEDGEVVKKYTIPHPEKGQAGPPERPESGVTRRGLQRMGTWIGKDEAKAKGEGSSAAAGEPGPSSRKKPKSGKKDDDSDDEGIRFTVGEKYSKPGTSRRMSKQDFIKQIQQLDPKAKVEVVDQMGAPEDIKAAARKNARRQEQSEQEQQMSSDPVIPATATSRGASDNNKVDQHLAASVLDASEDDLTDAESFVSDTDVPTHDVHSSLSRFSGDQPSAAQARRERLRRDSDDDGTERVTPAQRKAAAGLTIQSGGRPIVLDTDDTDNGEAETAAERRRRLAALGAGDEAGEVESDSDSDDDGEPRATKAKVQFADGTKPAAAKEVLSPPESSDQSPSSKKGHNPRISWGGERGRDREK